MFVRHVCAEGHEHGVSMQSSINLGDALLQIIRDWKIAEAWFLARLFIYQSSIVSKILDLIHLNGYHFSFDHMTGENRECFLSKQKSDKFYPTVLDSMKNAFIPWSQIAAPADAILFTRKIINNQLNNDITFCFTKSFSLPHRLFPHVLFSHLLIKHLLVVSGIF